MTTVPLAPCVTATIVNGSPSSSMSFATTSTVARASSSTTMASAAALGSRLAGSTTTNGESEGVVAQMPCAVVSTEIVRSTHTLLSRCMMRKPAVDVNDEGLYCEQT